MNPIIDMLNKQNPLATMLQPIYSAMQTAQDPMSGIYQMAMRDERMQQLADVVKQYGGIQQAVYAESQKRNINPDNALNQARQMMQTFNMK